MDPIEEQKQEIEVLKSIYPDELKELSNNEYFIVVALDTESDNKHKLKLGVKYPEDYPEVLPDLTLSVPTFEDMYNEEDEEEDDDEEEEYEDDDDINDDGDKIKPVIISETIFFEEHDLKELLNALYDEANMNLGIPSIFSIVSLLKDEAENQFTKKLEVAQKLHDDEILKREMEEQKKFHGTKVTKESYMEWRAKFRKEMGYDTREQERLEKLHHGKMTGKELFEKGIIGKDDEDIQDISVGISNM